MIIEKTETPNDINKIKTSLHLFCKKNLSFDGVVFSHQSHGVSTVNNNYELINALADAALELHLRSAESNTDHSLAIQHILRQISALSDE
ncbi:hypothetical protein CWC19_18410 [Pseudoalteromonas aurantia]|uniref:Uncharacterized protein n=1 Tax=Pseudoalteromonas aurantia TaxID=43654 RepID=A0A5S3V1I7_9GAMM|nr:hypothetical protein CWC19_18410 [Pseudoalteromonas aurantia]